MAKILVIDESTLFRGYLETKLKSCGFEVFQGANGLDGAVKARNELPDLIIMDYYLSRKSSLEVLQEIRQNPNTKETPVILISAKIDKTKIVEISRFGINKFFSKPLKMETLLASISEILSVKITMDETPCIIEAHFNDEILFIEVARGLNVEKIELLKYKITELLGIYKVHTPKVLIMMSSIDVSRDDEQKLSWFLDIILEEAQPNPKLIKILTTNEFVISYISRKIAYRSIGVTDSLEKAMDEMIGLKGDDITHDEVAASKILSSSAPLVDVDESIQLRVDDSLIKSPSGAARIAVVDDDIVIQEVVKTALSDTTWDITTFDNGKQFVDSLTENGWDLVFLDLMMPEMNGFQVLEHLKKVEKKYPVIIFSALSRKETVVKAVNFGVHSFLIKPLKPQQLYQKAREILNTNF